MRKISLKLLTKMLAMSALMGVGMSLQAQVTVPASLAINPPVSYPGGSLKGEYWQRPRVSILTDGRDNRANGIDNQIRTFGPATGTFKATQFVYLGNDLTPVPGYLGSDAFSFQGTSGNLDDGALRFTGYLNVPAAGVINMGLTSDDGSRITIGGVDIAERDGSHGDETQDMDVTFAAAGLYPIEITYFNGDWTSDGNNHSGNPDPGVHGGANFHLRMGGADVTANQVAMFHSVAPLPQLSVGLNFGADDNGAALGLAAADVAGVAPQANWNNLNGASGNASALTADQSGAAVPTTMTVEWASPNTWSSTGRGEEFNNFPAGANRTMMTGYIDTGDSDATKATVTVSGIPSEFTSGGYDVIVYTLGGVAGRGGAYSIGGETKYGTAAATAPSAFTEDQGLGLADTGTYVRFRGQFGSSFTLTASADAAIGGTLVNFRAPINGIQIVKNQNPDTGLVRGYLQKLRFNDIGNSVLLDDLLNNPKYVADQFDSSCFRPDFSANDADECDNCGLVVRGLFIPTASGPHTFYISADDGAGLFLSTDENPANKVLIAAEPAWTGRRNYVGGDGDGTGSGRDGASASGGPQKNISGPINLVAGNKYYIEGAVKEAGGGDNLDVAVQGPGDPAVADGDRPIFGSRIATRADLTGSSLAITQNPASSQVPEGDEATFTVVAAANSPLCGGATTYQWQRKRSGDADFTNVAGANGASYTFGPATPEDHLSNYRCVVAIPGITRISAAATMEVLGRECLRVAAVTGSGDFVHVGVLFSTFIDPVSSSTTDPFSYTVTGPGGVELLVTDVTLNGGGKSVTLTLDPSTPQVENSDYVVSVSGVTSLVGSDMCSAPDNEATFRSFVSSGPSGGVVFETFDVNNRLGVDDLVNQPNYPNNPREVMIIPGFDSRFAYTDDSHEDYAGRMRGLFIPPVTGNWVFHMRSDDPGRLYINPNGPSAAGKIQVGDQPGCCNGFPAGGGQVSRPFALEGGKGYYVELVYREFGGGDYGQVAVALQGDPGPTTANLIGPWVGVSNAPANVGGVLSIAQQPASVTVPAGDTATFTVGFNNPNELPVYVQWYRDGVAIAGANKASYSLVAAAGDNGAKFTVQGSIIGSVAPLSAEATLTVGSGPPPTFTVWMVGKDDNGWPVGDGGGENASFVQENGTINALPGLPNNPETDQQSDNDYYFAGDYTTVLPGNGTYTPVGGVPANEESAERAFAAADNDLRYHFNLPSTLRPDDELSVTFDPLNLHEGADVADSRYGIEVYFNGVKVQDQIVIRHADLNKAYTSPKFSLASVGAQTGPGVDNIVSLRGINYNAEGGGNWMGIDYVKLESTSNPDSGLVRGIVTVKRYNDIGNSVAVEDLLNNPKYVNNTPDSVCYRQEFSANDADECDNCGYSVSGYFIPTQSGPHTFYFAADDGGALFLSTDDSPGNKVMIAREPVWTSRRNYLGGDGDGTGSGRDGASPSGGPQQNISGPIDLVAGQKYFIEGVVKEAGGGDNLDVAVQGPGDPAVQDGDRPIFGDRIAAMADISGSVLTITQNPVNAQVVEGNNATFTVAADASSPLCGGTAKYQWQRDGVDIAGATGTSYSFGPVLISDSLAKFRCVVKIPGITRTSSAATLEVFPSECLKVVSAAGSFSRTTVTVLFSTLVDPDPAISGDPFNYTVAGSDGSLPTVISANINSDGKSVTLTTDELSETPQYTVTVDNVTSFVGSPMCSAPDNSAIVLPYVSSTEGYAGAVKADGPIAYWRFNDSLPTAVNEGSLGAAADGTYKGDAAPGSEAPKSPAFPGLELGNTALQLDGNGDFVGTTISLMNGLPSFTMSGWIRRGADQNNRTGLWGQNDIVEFGYINNNTLEVWTDNGLDVTPNPIANGEWAHLAVVNTGNPGTTIMYVNGAEVGRRDGSIPADNAFLFNIGGGGIFDDGNANGNYYNGQIDEVAVYSKALTPEQILRQYQSAFRTPGYSFEDGQLPPGTIASGTTAPYVKDGVLHLTDRVGSQVNFWTVPLDAPKTYSSIKATWKTLIDNPGGADGLSFTLGTDVGTSFTPEDGGAAGLSVCVDTYNNGAGDAGLDIKYNGVTLTHLPVPAAGGADGAGSPAELAIGSFVDTSVEVTDTGAVTFKYAGFTITGQIPNYAALGANQYVFAARTGGANENCWIDDVVFSGVELSGPATVTITLQPVDQTFVIAPVGAAGSTLLDQNFNAGDGGFTVLNGVGANATVGEEGWTYDATTGSWRANGGEGVKNTTLNTATLTVGQSGDVKLSFDHRYNFEDDGTTRWDGGAVFISVNGGAFTYVPADAFEANGYATPRLITGNSVPLNGKFGFNATSAGFAEGTFVTSVAKLGSFAAGDTIAVRFLGAWDEGYVQPPSPNWEINSVKITQGIAQAGVTFTTAATAVVPGVPNPALSYQWNRNGVAIPGATGTSYSFVPVLADNGAKFSCTATTAGANATSQEATLTVVQRNTPPQFACGPNQAVNEDAGAQVVPGWATDIQNHSIQRDEPILYGGDFSSVPPGSTSANRVLDQPSNAPLIHDGVLHLTDAVNGSQGSFATPSLPLVDSLTVTFKVRVGGGTCCGSPLPDGTGADRAADGWSLSIGDIALPVAFPSGAEEGAGNQLVVSFDSWDNGGLDDPATAPDVDVKVGGAIVAYQALDGVREGGRAPSGPFINDPATGLAMTAHTGDAYADVRVHLDPDGTLDVDFKGVRIYDNLPTGLTLPLANARLVLAARTGGANDNHWIDDLSIVATAPDASTVEAAQTVSFIVNNDNPSLFSAQPAIAPDGTLSYAGAPNAHGVANVTVVAMDNGGTANGGSDTSAACTFTITINNVCDAPVAVNDTGSATGSAAVTIDVLANDTDSEGGLAIASVTQGAHGTVAINGNSVVYTAAAGFSGVDTFTYTAANSCGSQATATVTVSVTSSGTAPTAVITTEQLVDFSPDYENPVLISCNWWNACIVLDGWTSSAANGGELTYLWFDELEPVPFDGGPVTTNCYEVGTHTITLIVTDSQGLTGTDSKTIEVVTGPLAIELLIEKVNQSRVVLTIKRELVATLRTALSQSRANNGRPVQGAMDAFEKKVRAKLKDAYPEQAREWIRWSQAVSAGVEKCIKLPSKKDYKDDKGTDPKKK